MRVAVATCQLRKPATLRKGQVLGPRARSLIYLQSQCANRWTINKPLHNVAVTSDAQCGATCACSLPPVCTNYVQASVVAKCGKWSTVYV